MLVVLLVLVIINTTVTNTRGQQNYASCQLELFKNTACFNSQGQFVKDISYNPGGTTGETAIDADATAGLPTCNTVNPAKDWTCADYSGPLPS